jgi:hypothetical protein
VCYTETRDTALDHIIRLDRISIHTLAQCVYSTLSTFVLLALII